jgi:hypothetical protein
MFSLSEEELPRQTTDKLPRRKYMPMQLVSGIPGAYEDLHLQ